jgi:uncharacterized protein involved in outer membrane biogenesis
VIRRIAITFAALLAGFIIVWLMVLVLGMTVRLDVLRNPIETAASHALGREVHVLGAIEVRPTLGPTVVAHGVRIADPGGQNGVDLLLADRVEARLGLTGLLRGRPYVTRLLIHDVSINLQTHGDGSRSWRADNRAAVDHASSRRPSGRPAPAIRQRELKDLSLHNIVLSYRDDRTGRQYHLRLDEISGSAMPGEPLDLLIRGSIGRQTYAAKLTGGNLSEFLAFPAIWPLRITVNMADASLVLNGTLDDSRPGQGPALDFELRGERLPAIGESMIHGRLAASDSGLELTVVEARLGQSALQGRVSARLDAAHPHITAALQASVLDAALLDVVGSRHEAAGPSPSTGGSPAERTSDVPGWLESADLDAVITIQEFVHSPIAIRNASLKLTMRDGNLSAPLDVLIADHPFHGELIVNRQSGRPALKLTLNARDIVAGKLVENLTGLQGIRGKFNHIEFHAVSDNSSAVNLLNGFDLGLTVTGALLSYGHVAGGRPVDLALDDLALTIPRGKELSVIAHGSLLNEPFTIEFTGGAPGNLLRHEAGTVNLSATGSGATLGINGTLAGTRDQSQTRLDLVLSGERLGDLADWFGVSPCAETPYTVRGQLIISANVKRLQFLQARLGRTQLNGDLDWSVDEQTPLLHAMMHFNVLDPDDVDGLMPIMDSGNAGAAKKGMAFDMPILPRRIEINNADIKLTSEKLHLKPVDISDVYLSSQIRGGKWMRSPFHAQIGATSFTGYLDPSGTATDVVFEIEGNDRNSGDRLQDLFSTAVRWAGSAAVIPMQWLFKKELSSKGADDCRARISRTPKHP